MSTPAAPAAPVSSCDVDELFRLFTLQPDEFTKQYLIMDLRDQKHFKKQHVVHAFCVRLSSNGKVLADYSGASYRVKWSNDVWVGRHVFLYSDSGVSKSHPVAQFLASHSAHSVRCLKEGFSAFESAYPFLCTNLTTAGSYKRYPSQILPGLLYLGDWNDALATERLAELNIKHVVTVHNNPENLEGKLPSSFKWLQWTRADVETADIASCFAKTFDFIEDARAKNQGVLVHCGAGVSRSATLCCMYLMRRFLWNAAKARAHCIERRSVVCPNDGFWRVLCALEPVLGITDRSDVEAGAMGFQGADEAPPPAVSQDAIGGRVQVQNLSKDEVTQVKKRAREQEDSQPAAKRHQPGSKSLMVTLEIRKPEGCVGGVTLGPIAPNQRVIFGRLPSNDVMAEHASISRQHAALSVDASGTLLLTDLQSGHGTKLDDTWLRPNAPKPIKQGSVFLLGASTRQYVVAHIDRAHQ